MDHSIKTRLLRALQGVRSLHWKWTLLAAALVAVLSWLLLLPAPRGDDDGLPDGSQPTADAQKPASPSVAASPAQPTAAEPAPHADLLPGLSAENSGDRIEALRSIEAAGALSTLPSLLQFDLAADPEVAPTLIATVTKLSAHADSAQRSAVAQRLAGWLQSEQARDARDARGNIASLVKALGAIDSPEATRALSEALDAQQLPLHVETVAVQGLSHSGDAERARPAVERFRMRLQQAPAADGFERELQQEAMTAADRALAHWSGRLAPDGRDPSDNHRSPALRGGSG
ncbi:MAG TPA: hypothetical protein VJV78_06745 [Polyangiales bacterium]|nr:hypothetical protein [Polyangiales bacterium]